MHLSSNCSRRRFLVGTAALLAGLRVPGLRADDAPKIVTFDEWVKERVAAAPLAMQFRGGSADDCRQWQTTFAAKLRSLLGPHTPPAKWKTVVQDTAERDDHRREQLLLIADDVPPLPVYLLIPKKAGKRLPGVVAIHGHGGHGYDPIAGRDDLPGVANAIKSANYDYGRQLVRRGYVVAAPCLTPFGPRSGRRDEAVKEDACAVALVRLQLLGKLLMAENLRDCLWAVELLARDERVDAARLGCVGLSLGGRMTMLTTALEPRIKAAAISGALNVMQERISKPYSCGAQVIPGLLNFGDVPEIGSLIAPRPCVWEAGLKDALIAEKWMEEALVRLRRAYKALGAEDALQLDRHDGGHVWSGRLAFPLLEKVLG